jgi:hypothetical protein
LDELEISPMTVLGNLREDARFPAAERRFESAGVDRSLDRRIECNKLGFGLGAITRVNPRDDGLEREVLCAAMRKGRVRDVVANRAVLQQLAA